MRKHQNVKRLFRIFFLKNVHLPIFRLKCGSNITYDFETSDALKLIQPGTAFLYIMLPFYLEEFKIAFSYIERDYDVLTEELGIAYFTVITTN